MAELAAAEVYTPGPTGAALQAWRAAVAWACFLFQLLLQILRGSSSWPGAVSFAGLRHRLVPSSSSSLPAVFRPLPATADDDGPPAGESFDKLTVVLDLDETLVCAYETSSLPLVVRDQAMEAGVKCFELECFSMDKDVDRKPKVNHITVFERPGLREFLQQSSEFANLVLFTAGLEGYAGPLVDRIDIDNKLSQRLYRPSTVTTEYREHVKDLSCLSKDLSRVVIVDNNPFSFLLQPLNGIPCVPFSPGQPYDEQLTGVLLPLLKHLSLQKDVRPVLYEKFHMREWFQQHGIPTIGST